MRAAPRPQVCPIIAQEGPEWMPMPHSHTMSWRKLADALIFADCEGRIRVWNGAAEALFGFPASAAIGQSLDLIIPERFACGPLEWIQPRGGSPPDAARRQGGDDARPRRPGPRSM